MAAQTAHDTHRCGACAQSFRLRPERIAVGSEANVQYAACCPFCGFLNHPQPVVEPARTTIKIVRPPEPDLQPAAVPAVATLSGCSPIRRAAARLRRLPSAAALAPSKPVLGSIFEPAAL